MQTVVIVETKECPAVVTINYFRRTETELVNSWENSSRSEFVPPNTSKGFTLGELDNISVANLPLGSTGLRSALNQTSAR